ncbi:aminodeoxychorismate synthase component I [Zhongshania sp.]|jgi:para-aminobenzoate synthetase component 1|uniref:aminodeoxychorismate synthase component I n=1 Tax=Zhongshania sp. TaxID=1971902 RepID=UPI0039E6DFCC
MTRLRRILLPYSRDSCAIFASLKHLPFPVFLDSAAPFSDYGRFDIICAQPDEVISLKTIAYDSIETFIINTELRLAEVCSNYIHDEELPFCGGAIGYLSYDFAEITHSIRHQQAENDRSATPYFHAGIYPWAIVVDHQRRHCELVAQASVSAACLAHIEGLVVATEPDAKPASFALTGIFETSLDIQQYRQAFDRVQDYIHAGDCYQINLTRAFTAPYKGDPWQAYQVLRKTAATPFSAYLDLGDSQILSFSPERLLSASKGQLQTQPIKGTAARDPDPIKDQALAAALQSCAKNRAENVMIVDLLRNDFSKSCQPLSVRTEKLCELQSFRTVHHLVSTVSGQLRPDCTAFKALLNCFPGGSITGAPKQRAMEIIGEIEPHRRDFYCGSIFYLGGGGKMDSSITIRSFVCADNHIRGWAGGGIVADSEVDEEFIETETKIGKLLKTLADF